MFIPALALLCSPLAQEAATHPEVKVVKIRASVAVVRTVRGSYSQSPKVMEEMMRYVHTNFRAVGDCFGIYPDDPDKVAAADLKWTVGVRVTTGEPMGYGHTASMKEIEGKDPAAIQKQLKAPKQPYSISLIPGGEVAVIQTSVRNAGKDGLYMFKWMAENGYVQIHPTRMEYLSHKGPPMQIPVRIVVPVKKRASGLKLEG
jgi:DNA gyrase inhibitor GyrI